ncbi:hypothetical protein A8L34_27015 [Bacillus sp. FJAT-27264]|uniref:hypothetical protein n=1 Tax=Paenibacillus sp. (strain DSM 101736 / FJAT-27264) TaxID=1850362 RepID=UPI000807F0B0|nr:hypothetical protein [Bacillus sp. FJAT-27264]OBZ16332.1 hypothetical protein A8L34_27015 [Bacillus sp. FJAT-27264]
MSRQLDRKVREKGTRFLVYPQFRGIQGFQKPEVIYLNAEPGSIQAGPEDDRQYVIDAVGKRPYRNGEGPPYTGKRNPPLQPDAQGHFDHVQPGSREFSAAAMFATIRRTQDIWEDYFKIKITPPQKLLLIPLIDWNNAQAGSNFLEFGYAEDAGKRYPYCENFDVLSHEEGHFIKDQIIGYPSNGNDTEEYHGHHEAFGDLVAIVASLHFNTVLDELLEHTSGNLFTENELSRLGEFGLNRFIRLAFNDRKLSDVRERSGEEPWRREEHALSEPFTGGVFDILVEVFQIALIERNLISTDLGRRSYDTHHNPSEAAVIQKEFEQLYAGNEDQFRDCLIDARDFLGNLMAEAWKQTRPDKLTYSKVLQNILDADRKISGGKYQQTIIGCFDWREILAPTVSANSQTWTKPHIIEELAYDPAKEGVTFQ